MWVLFDDESEALKLTQAIEVAQGIPRPGTTEWGAPKKHPSRDEWAVAASDPGYPVPTPASAIGEVEELPEDWLPTLPEVV